MEMQRTSDVLRELLVRQGMHDRTAGTVLVMVNGDEASAGKSAQPHQPVGREDNRPMGISGKGRQVNAAAKFTGLHVVVDNSRCMPLRDPTRSAQRGSGIHLVWSR